MKFTKNNNDRIRTNIRILSNIIALLYSHSTLEIIMYAVKLTIK